MSTNYQIDYRDDYQQGKSAVLEAAQAESLMTQIDSAHKMASILRESISHLADRLMPVCQPERPMIDGVEGRLQRVQSEPAPAVQGVLGLKEILANCDRQIQSIQSRLAL